MFLSPRADKTPPKGFPRIRGDVPHPSRYWANPPTFSPHTRGCSASNCSSKRFVCVFPAYAGMFRNLIGQDRGYGGFPRIRGDVPPFRVSLPRRWKFSPHTRGCSCSTIFWRGSTMVFPAYAGMFRTSSTVKEVASCFPRIRGDVPYEQPDGSFSIMFSPHTRGCSAQSPHPQAHSLVFPAYAGMFRVLTIC